MSDPVIEIQSLKFDYGAEKDRLPVLHIPHWHVKRGTKTAIFGPSGSGKSTFLYTIAGLLPVAAGQVSVCGCRLETMSESRRDRFRAEHIGFIYQNFNLMQGFNALENVLLGMTFSPKKGDLLEARRLLDEVGLSHRLESYPSQMSSGEQQRVAVARALANRPTILLADEPTASLHPVNKETVLGLLLDVCERYNCTLIVVTHEREVLGLFRETIAFTDFNHAYQEPEGKN